MQGTVEAVGEAKEVAKVLEGGWVVLAPSTYANARIGRRACTGETAR